MAKLRTAADECLMQVGPCSHCGWTGPEHRFSLGDYQGAKTARETAALERDEHRCEEIIAAERERVAEDDEPHQT